MPRYVASHSIERSGRGIHGVMVIPAMHVQIDEPGSHGGPRQVDLALGDHRSVRVPSAHGRDAPAGNAYVAKR
jgi:hypothetical protein